MSQSEEFVLEWPDFSDGTSNKWPGPPYVRVESSHTVDVWLQRIGQAIATVSLRENPEKYRMTGWPAAYAVFSLARGDSTKSDHYLYGGPRKFRSAPDFQEHAVWLYFSGNPPEGYEDLLSSPSKKSRIGNAVASSLSAKKRSESSATPAPRTQLIPKRQKPHTTKHVTFQDLPQMEAEHSNTPITLLLTLAPERQKSQGLHPVREQINRPSRIYRVGELVWCIIKPKLLDSDTSISIDQWPGLIEAYRVKKTVLSGGSVTEEGLYHVKLLALKDAFVVSSHLIMPYRRHNPSPKLISLLQSLPPPSTSHLPSQLYHFHQNIPYLLVQHQEEEQKPPENMFLQATAVYAVALQIAARLALTWGFAYPKLRESDTEDWDTEVTVEFSGIWWGPELVYEEEMALTILHRKHLIEHPTTSAYVKEDSVAGGVIVQIKHFEARSLTAKDLKRRAFVVGILYELVPLLSDTTPDPVSTMPKQTAPLGMMWKRILPPGLEVCMDIMLLRGRCYEDIGLLPVDPDSIARDKSHDLQGLDYSEENNAHPPTSYHNKRGQMCRAAKKEATLDLEEHWGIQIVPA